LFKEEGREMRGKLPIRIVLAMGLSLLVSFLLNGYFFQSYWGYPVQADSLFSFTIFFSLLFLAMNIFDNEKERIGAYKMFSIGALFLACLYLFQIYYGAKNGISMMLPSSEESAIIFSLGLTYYIYGIFNGFNMGKDNKGLLKMVFSIAISLVFVVMLYLMGIKLAWLLAAFGAFFVFWKFMQRRKFDINSPEPFVSFILIIFFIANFLLPLSDMPALKPLFSAEPLPTQAQSYGIVEKSISTDIGKFFFGTGAASFPYNFSLNTDNSFADKDMVFTHPSSAFLLIVNDFGTIGGLTFLAMILYFLWFSVRILLKQKKEEKDSDEILFISPLFMLFYSLFFYRFSFLVMGITFLFLGLWLSSREYGKNDSLSPVYAKVLFPLILLGLVINGYYLSMQYSAEAKYQEAAIASEKKEDIEKVISLLEESKNKFPNSDTDIALSGLYLAKSANLYDEYLNNLDKLKGNEAKKNESKELIAKSEASAKKAVENDPRDYRTWSNLAYVYKNIETVSGEKKGDSIENYEKAEKLAPSNYRIYLSHAQKLEEDGDLLGAFELYKKAHELNPEFQGLKEFIDAISEELDNADINGK
jgi:tetratricopeptide (TPR) repeat protein